MPSFNRVTLLGNVTRDPQIKVLPSQTSVAEFGMAMNRKFKNGSGEDKEEVCFVDCAAFGKQAEVIGQYVTKGKPLFIEGRLKFDTWEDKQGGKRSKLSIIVENFQFVGGRDDAGGGDGHDQRGNDRGRQDEAPGYGNVPGNAVRPRQSAGPSQRPRGPMATAPAQGGSDFDDSSIPF